MMEPAHKDITNDAIEENMNAFMNSHTPQQLLQTEIYARHRHDGHHDGHHDGRPKSYGTPTPETRDRSL